MIFGKNILSMFTYPLWHRRVRAGSQINNGDWLHYCPHFKIFKVGVLKKHRKHGGSEEKNRHDHKNDILVDNSTKERGNEVV